MKENKSRGWLVQRKKWARRTIIRLNNRYYIRIRDLDHLCSKFILLFVWEPWRQILSMPSKGDVSEGRYAKFICMHHRTKKRFDSVWFHLHLHIRRFKISFNVVPFIGVKYDVQYCKQAISTRLNPSKNSRPVSNRYKTNFLPTANAVRI